MTENKDIFNLFDHISLDEKAQIYQNIQDFSPLLGKDSKVLVYSHSYPKNENETWTIHFQIESPLYKIEAQGANVLFYKALHEAKEKIVRSLIEIQGQLESQTERSQKVDIMANESFKYNLH